MDNDDGFSLNEIDWKSRVLPSRYVPDTKSVRRTWIERLFSRPWNPLRRYKVVKTPLAFVLNGIVLCSYDTYNRIKKETQVNDKRCI